jgi:hypothetical protein
VYSTKSEGADWQLHQCILGISKPVSLDGLSAYKHDSLQICNVTGWRALGDWGTL